MRKQTEQAEKELGIEWVDEIVCAGHISPKMLRCYQCENVPSNTECEHYEPKVVKRYVQR